MTARQLTRLKRWLKRGPRMTKRQRVEYLRRLLKSSASVLTRIRNGREELVPPVSGYRTHSGEPTKCENDWHDNHSGDDACPECGENCTCLD